MGASPQGGTVPYSLRSPSQQAVSSLRVTVTRTTPSTTKATAMKKNPIYTVVYRYHNNTSVWSCSALDKSEAARRLKYIIPKAQILMIWAD